MCYPFDRCHIAALLQELANKGIRNKLLCAVKGMYDGAEAKLFINYELSEPFKLLVGIICPPELLSI